MAHPRKMPQKRGPVKMTREIIDHITDPKILRGWAHLNLEERCCLVEAKFGVKMTGQALGWWYRKNGVTKTRPQYKFLGALKRKRLRSEQVDWCYDISKFMRRGFDIVWIDETTTNLWDCQSKVWQQRGDPLTIYRSSDRGKSQTIIGGLFMKSAELRWSFAKSTNKEDFLEFLKNQIDRFTKYPRTTVLVLDNHRAHHAKTVQAWLVEKQYQVAFLPPYSSEFNPIETVWAMVKREWSRVLLSSEFETRILRHSRPLKVLKEEFDEGSDGELIITTRQQLHQNEIRDRLEKILDNMDRRRLSKLSRGCCKQMVQLMKQACEGPGGI